MRFRIPLQVLATCAVAGLLHAQPQDSVARVYIPFALHAPVLQSNGALAWEVDGFGRSVNGNQQPWFDTLIGIANPTLHPVNVRFAFFDSLGKPQLWGDGMPYRDYVLRPNCSLATTLIPYNVFPDPPQNFSGYGTLELTYLSGSAGPPDLPVYALIGGGGFYPHHWNNFSASIPVYKHPIPLRQKWFFPYLIPFFEDANHAKEAAYRTGMIITNFGDESVELRLTYRIGEVYPGAGEAVSFKKTIAAKQSAAFDIYDELVGAGYRDSMNSEGWLQIESDRRAAVVPYLLHSNRGYDKFSAGQQAVTLEGL